MKHGKAKRAVGTGLVLAGGLGWLALQSVFGGHGGCGSINPQITTSSAALIAHAPTVSAQTLAWELHQRQSPLSADDATFIAQQSEQEGIDDAFAVALWAEETQDGATAFAGTYNLGNVTGTPGITVTGNDGKTRTFRIYGSWQEAIAAWFSMVKQLYVLGGHAPDLGTFALYYVDGLLPDDPGASADLDAMEAAPTATTPGGYVWQVKTLIAAMQAQEQRTNPSGAPQSGGGNSAASQPLATLLPAGVSHAWASTDALTAASLLTVLNCQQSGTTLNGLTALQGQATLLQQILQLTGHLVSDGRFFDSWDGQAPTGVRSQQGVVWCTDYIASVYQALTGKTFPAFPDADEWMGTVGQAPGFHAVAPSPGVSPQPGTVVVLETAWKGHVALVVGVQPPTGDQPGFLLVTQAHATTALEKWTLFPDGTALPPWADVATRTLGYIQMQALAPHSVAALVQPIIQAFNNGQYDSQAQRDVWWDSTCSAASFTEVARAWGITTVTIGQVVDRLVAHSPPYITVSGGLMSPDGWPWMAAAYHLQAQVAWHAFTFDSLIQQVNSTGIPVVIGMDGGNPANPWGHYVVVVGGDSTQAQIVDSSLWKMHALPRSFFAGPTGGIINEPIWWTGESILLTPA